MPRGAGAWRDADATSSDGPDVGLEVGALLAATAGATARQPSSACRRAAPCAAAVLLVGACAAAAGALAGPLGRAPPLSRAAPAEAVQAAEENPDQRVARLQARLEAAEEKAQRLEREAADGSLRGLTAKSAPEESPDQRIAWLQARLEAADGSLRGLTAETQRLEAATKDTGRSVLRPLTSPKKKKKADDAGAEPDEAPQADDAGAEPDEAPQADDAGAEPDEALQADVSGTEPDEALQAPAATSEPALVCPETCTPEERVVPDIVIPFFERDLCKLKYTAKSLGTHDPDHNLGDVYLMWVSNNPASSYKEDLDEVMRTLSETRKVHLFDFSTSMKSYDLDGWHAQQLLKLKIASVVKSEYYLVMDSKNTLIKHVKEDTFFNQCNQARIFAQFNWTNIPSPHNGWYKKAAETLGVDPPLDKPYPASITPILLHKKTVLDMLAYVGEGAGILKLCDGMLCPLFGVGDTSGQGTTEFTMYNMFSYTKTKLECTSAPEKHTDDAKDQWGLSLWRGVAENKEQVMHENMVTLRNITQGILQPLMFGSQPSALDGLTERQRAEAEDLLGQLYEGAGAYQKAGKTSIKALVACAIGSYEYGKNEKKFN